MGAPACARRPLRAALDRALNSRWVPYPIKSRLSWRRDQGRWRSERPETFTGKVRWKMLKDRRPLLTTFADKVAVRDYVARVVGVDCLTELYAVASDPLELDPGKLPRQFVAKVNHGLGGVWFVGDIEGVPDKWDARARFTTPVTLDWEDFVETFRAWLRPFSEYVEWGYRRIPPKLLVEELLLEGDGTLPRDYKLYVIHGRVHLVHVDVERFTEHRRRLYLPDWTPLDVSYEYPLAPAQPAPPATLARMVEIAEALGRETDFVRVDLYDVDGRVVFGELTNYPEGGRGVFRPASFDRELGAQWRLPPRYA